jgi:hypothetical protein
MKYENIEKANQLDSEIKSCESAIYALGKAALISFIKYGMETTISFPIGFTDSESEEKEISLAYTRQLIDLYQSRILKLKSEIEKL